MHSKQLVTANKTVSYAHVICKTTTRSSASRIRPDRLVVTTVSTCTGQVRKQIVGTGTGAIITTAAFDAVGNLLSRRDATGAGTDFTYDALGRKLTETDAAIVGKVRSFTYDLANRLITATDPLGIVTTFAYDLRDRKISESTPMTGSITRLIQYGYNGRGLMTTLTDANAAVTTWAYDAAGRQVSKTYANGDHREMAYDAAGRLVTLTDVPSPQGDKTAPRSGSGPNGYDITSVYDLAGRLVSKTFAADSTTDTYVYDAASRMTSVTKGRYAHTLTYAYDSVGRLATETHPDGTVITHVYDSANRLANLSLGGAGSPAVYSVDYGYDARGLLSSVTSRDYASVYDYRINGQLHSTVHSQLSTPAGDILRTDLSYDAGARLLGVANTAANNDQAGVVYTLGLDDQRTEALEENGQKWEYGYDGLKQLVTAKKTDTQAVVVSPLDQSYSYDPMGNRAAYTDTTGSTAYTANNVNQYTAVGGIASVYDRNGNLLSDGVKNYTWDAENQLIAVAPVSPVEGSQKVEYTYDWRMRRTGKKSYIYASGTWVLAKTTGFKYHEWNPIVEAITDNSQLSPSTSMKSYIWGNDLSGNLHGAGGVGGLLSMSVLSPAGSSLSPARYFYAYDGNGNVRALVKADAANPAASAITARYAYDGFGKEVAVSGVDADKNVFRFSTKQLDAETGMNYYGYRYYAADAGRWINRDPIVEAGGLNIYEMVGNDCVMSIDCFGLVSSSEIAPLPSLPLAGANSFSVSGYGYQNLGRDGSTSPLTLSANANWSLSASVSAGSSVSIGYTGTVSGSVSFKTSVSLTTGLSNSVEKNVDYTADAYKLQKWESGTESYSTGDTSCPNGWTFSEYYLPPPISPTPPVGPIGSGTCIRTCSRSAYRLVGETITTDVLGLSKYNANEKQYNDIESIQREINSQVENAVRSQITAIGK